MRCSYCPNPHGLGYGKGNMSMETWQRVLYWTERLKHNQPRKEPVTWLHGIGEPLLNPHLVEMVRSMSPITKVGFSTNGKILDEELAVALGDAGLTILTISTHDLEAAFAAQEACRCVDAPYLVVFQALFDDDWAGQVQGVDVPHLKQFATDYYCAHLELGGVQVNWRGDIITCCVDAQGDPVLGSVYDDDIMGIDIEPISLCKSCRSYRPVKAAA